MSILTIKNLRKLYKKNVAVDDVSFDIPEGAVYGLVGLNGAGKTTIIKSVTGLLKKFTGTVEIDGQKWGTTEYRRRFAYLPELFSPHFYLTGWEYINFIQKLHGASVDKDRVLELCDKLNFDRKFLDRKTNTYSKGTAQKLGVMQTICTPTKLMIFDEPMSGLDPLARAQFKSVLLAEHNSGRTILFSTHILHDIDTLCTHVGILNKGKILFSDTPQALKSKNNAADLESAFLKELL
jgi:ABC-2 type transport system ATP-binding protein